MKSRMLFKAVITFLLLISFSFSFIGCEKTPEEEFLDGMIVIYHGNIAAVPLELMPICVTDYTDASVKPIENEIYSDEQFNEVKKLVIDEIYGIKIPECSYVSTDQDSSVNYSYSRYRSENKDSTIYYNIAENPDFYEGDFYLYCDDDREDEDEKEYERMANAAAKSFFKDKYDLCKYESTYTGKSYFASWELKKGDIFICSLNVTVYEDYMKCSIDKYGVSPEVYDYIPDVTTEDMQEAIRNKLEEVYSEDENFDKLEVTFYLEHSISYCTEGFVVNHSSQYGEYYICINFPYVVFYKDGSSVRKDTNVAFPFAIP